MARTGGGRSGGGRSSGGRSSGGRSSGGRSSGGRSSGGMGRSYRAGSASYRGYRRHYSGGSGGGNPSPLRFVPLIIFIAVWLLGACGSCISEIRSEIIWELEPDYETETIVDIRPSTVNREPLDTSKTQPIEQYIEDSGKLLNVTERQSVIDAMITFYGETGVQPYLWTATDIYGSGSPSDEAFARALEEKYISLFGDDEGHFILFYFEYPSGKYYIDYAVGDDAYAGPLDYEACEMILDFVQFNYDEHGKYYYYGNMFCETFYDSSKRIMGGITPVDEIIGEVQEPSGVSCAGVGTVFVVFAVGVGVTVFVAVLIITKKPAADDEKKKKSREEKFAAEAGQPSSISELDRAKERYRRKYQKK